MNLEELSQIIESHNFKNKTFKAYNFGCRVNAAEINLLSQLLLNLGLTPTKDDIETPDVCLVNTCSITKKGDKESLGQIRHLAKQYPDSLTIATGCASLNKLSNLSNVITFSNKDKEDILEDLNCAYTPEINDKFSHTNRYILKIQSGCTQFCTYCTVPHRRQYLWSLPIEKAVDTVKKATANGYKEIIITGVNLDQYSYGFSNLIEALLTRTNIPLISFGSIPLNCINDKFLSLITDYRLRITGHLHIPLQSGSNKILKLMNRPYDKQKILDVFSRIKNLESNVSLGTDIIVGFPGETDDDFQETFELCQSVGFTQIHTFRYSPRPNTLAKLIHQKSPKISKEVLKTRSQQIRSLIQKA